MQKNHDPKVIVMDRELFDNLMWGASRGNNPRRVIAHVRKWNPHYNTELLAEQKRLKDEDNAMRQKVRELVRRHLGMTVYRRAAEGVYSPLIVLGRGLKDKRQLYVLETRDNRKREVPVNSILEDIPINYQLVKGGQYNGYYMFAWDPNETQQEG